MDRTFGSSLQEGESVSSPIQRFGLHWTPEAPSLVSAPPGLPVPGLEGRPPGCRTTFPWPNLQFPAELSLSLSEPRQPGMELYYYTTAALYIPGAELWVGESLSNDSLHSKAGCEALKTQHSQ